MGDEYNIFGGTMAGMASPTKREHHEESSPKRRTRTEATPPTPPRKFDKVTYIQQVKSSILDEWEKRPPADPDAVILGTDYWKRKIELHNPGWEESQGIGRRFTVGQRVRLTHGLMASSLDMPQFAVYNDPGPEDLDQYKAAIEEHGVEHAGPKTAKHIPAGYTGTIIKPAGLDGYATEGSITIGHCPMYAVLLEEGPLKALVSLEFPDGIMDDIGFDGYGNKVENGIITTTPGGWIKDKTAPGVYQSMKKE